MKTEFRLYLGVGLPVLLGALDLTVISAVLPVVIGELDLVVPEGVRQASWLVVGYLIAYAVGIVAGGRLGDRFGSRRVLLWSVLLFGGASLGLIAFNDGPVRIVQEVAYRGFEARPDPSVVTLAVLTGWRILQALGAGAVVPAGMAFGWKSLRTRGWLGFVAAVDLLGWTFGHLYGGIVVRYFDWPVAFWLNVPAAAVAYLVIRALPADEPRPDLRFPVGPFLSVAAGTAALVVGMGGAEGSTLPIRPIYLVAGGLALAWGLHRGRTSLFPWETVVRHRLVLGANLAVGYLVFLLLAAVPIFVSVLVETETAPAAWVTGWTLTAFTVPLAITALLGGRWAGRRILAAGILATAVGVGLVATWEPEIPAVLPALLIAGTGLGWLFAPLAEIPLRETSDDTAGAVSSMIILLRLLGMAAGSAILTSFVLSGIAGLDVASGVTEAVVGVFHDIPWIALPVVVLLLPVAVPRRQV